MLPLLIASGLAAATIASIVVLLGRTYLDAASDLPPLSDHQGGIEREFLDRIALFRLLVRWRVSSRYSLIPTTARKELSKTWSRSGRRSRELPLFVAKLEIIVLLGATILVGLTVLTGSFAFGTFMALPILMSARLVYSRFKDDVLFRRQQIERELPYVLDLLAMMLYGGGNVFLALQSLTSVAVRTPLMEELRAVTGTLQMGKSFSDAMRTFAERINSDAVKSLVLSVEQGERLGTPLQNTLKSMARTIRSKRILAAEEAAQTAGVQVFIPSSLVMLALMIILLAPSIIKMFKAT